MRRCNATVCKFWSGGSCISQLESIPGIDEHGVCGGYVKSAFAINFRPNQECTVEEVTAPVEKNKEANVSASKKDS